MIVCLDSFALLTWLKNEPGAATELQAPLATGDPEIVAVQAQLGLMLIRLP